jgi:hypothetical protein
MLAWIFAVIAVVPTPKSELHVIAVYESILRVQGQKLPQPVAVVVNRPGKDVTLVLSAYESTKWEVVVGRGSNVTMVILGGSKKQTADVPKGVEVVEMFREGREGKDHVSASYNTDSGRLRSTVLAIHKLTGREISSYQGMYNNDGAKPLFVDSVQNDERLRSDYPPLTPQGELPKIRFHSAHFTKLGLGRDSGSFGVFTEKGPDKQSLTPLPEGISTITYDPTGKKYFAIKGHAFHEVDVVKGTTERLEPGPGLPEVSWPCGMTFDTKRGRMVGVTLGGKGYMYTYIPATGAWAVPADLNNIDLSALAYHAADDILYGIAAERGGDSSGGIPTLYHYNAQGALLKTTRLGSPMFPGVLAQGPQTRVQMVSAGDHLAVLVSGVGMRDGDGPRGTGESFLYIIDTRTGKAKLAWKE